MVSSQASGFPSRLAANFLSSNEALQGLPNFLLRIRLFYGSVHAKQQVMRRFLASSRGARLPKKIAGGQKQALSGLGNLR